MFIFLLGVFTPLGLSFVQFLRDRSKDQVRIAFKMMFANAASGSFDVLEIRRDREGAVGALSAALQARGVRVATSGPVQHAVVVERMARSLKSRDQCHELALPCVMPHTPTVWCVHFCMNCINLQPDASSTDRVSPHGQFFGMKLDAKRDLRVAFGDYVLATTTKTNNSMVPRTEPFIALGRKGIPPGSLWMLSLKTKKVVTRDQFAHLSMSDIVIEKVTRQALGQGYTRGEDPTLEITAGLDEDDDDEFLSATMDIDGKANELPRACP